MVNFGFTPVPTGRTVSCHLAKIFFSWKFHHKPRAGEAFLYLWTRFVELFCYFFVDEIVVHHVRFIPISLSLLLEKLCAIVLLYFCWWNSGVSRSVQSLIFSVSYLFLCYSVLLFKTRVFLSTKIVEAGYHCKGFCLQFVNSWIPIFFKLRSLKSF